MANDINPPGDVLRKTLKWVAEIQQSHPEKNREEIIKEAEIRFNLSPKDCEFLDKNFS
jgi:hypothetical protein